MYFWLSLAFNLLGAIFAGIQFAKLSAALKSKSEKEYDFSSRFSYTLIAFAIPFFSPISLHLGATVSFFIAVTAVSTLVLSRTTKYGS